MLRRKQLVPKEHVAFSVSNLFPRQRFVNLPLSMVLQIYHLLSLRILVEEEYIYPVNLKEYLLLLSRKFLESSRI